MKLRSLMGFFAIGVLALPLSLVLLTRMFIGTGDHAEAAIPRGIAAFQVLMNAIEKDGSGAPRIKAGAAVPDWMELVVADTSGSVVFSSLPQIQAGSRAESAGLAASVLAPKLGYRTMAESFSVGGEIIGTYAMRYKTDIINLSSDPAAPFLLLLFLLGLTALVTLLSGIVSARIAGSFRKLERAARGIAAGDLESAVPSGSKAGIRELSSLSKAMETMRSSLKEDRSRRSRFLAAVSHDLRTPLTSIKGYLEAVEDGMASDPRTMSKYLGIMREKAAVLEDRVNELLDFARMSTGEWRLRLCEIDLGDFLAGLCATYREDALAAGREFECASEGIEGLRLPADPKMLSRALENVFSNALRYSPPGSAISLSAFRDQSSAQIVFSDSGPGIPVDELGRIFDPYFRGKAVSGEGEGLGLSISRSILQDHGWEIKAASPPEGGSRFVITIPLAG